MGRNRINNLLYVLLILIDALLFLRIVYVFFDVHTWVLLAPVMYGITFVLLLPIYVVLPDLRFVIGFDTGAFAGILFYSFILNTIILLNNLRGRKPTIQNIEEAEGVKPLISEATHIQHEVGKVEDKIPGIDIQPSPQKLTPTQQNTQIRPNQVKQQSRSPDEQISRSNQHQEYQKNVQPPQELQAQQQINPSPSTVQTQSKRRKKRRHQQRQQQSEAQTLKSQEHEIKPQEIWPEDTPVKIEEE